MRIFVPQPRRFGRVMSNPTKQLLEECGEFTALQHASRILARILLYLYSGAAQGFGGSLARLRFNQEFVLASSWKENEQHPDYPQNVAFSRIDFKATEHDLAKRNH